MSLIEGIGDEVTHFFLTFFVVILVIIAWWSTNITDQRQYRAVVLLDRRRRRPILRRIQPRRILNQTEVSSIQGINLPSTVHVVLAEEDAAVATSENNSESDTNGAANPSSVVEENNPEEPSTSGETEPRTSLSEPTLRQSEITHISQPEEEDSASDRSITQSEVHHIIRAMDADKNDVQVRLRRLAHFDNQTERNQGDGEESTSECRTPQPTCDTASNNAEQEKGPELRRRNVDQPNTSTESSPSFTIKLKYINDDIRIVDGRSEELLGDFKRRHFHQEEASNKTVKLIFNGQVLKRDNQTLHSCGMFDNCVVHCLVHPKRSTDNHQPRVNNDGSNMDYFIRERSERLSNLNNNNQGIDWDLGNFLFALISFILLAAWYFRYVYAHLYTVTATIGLILITGIFTVVLVGMCFPDNYENVPIPTIRIARTERIEVQGDQQQPAQS